MKKKIIFLGSTGFIGKSLLKKIKNKYIILQINSKSLIKQNRHLNFNDLRKNFTEIIKFEPDIILDLGWKGIPNYSIKNSLQNINQKIFFYEKMLKIKSVKKIIITGTCFEYKHHNKKCREDDEINYYHNLSWSKLSIYNFLKQKCESLNINLIWLRLFYVYGSGQKKTSLIPHIVNSINSNKLPNIKNLNYENDFVHKNDVTNLIDIILKKKIISGIYNVGTGKSTAIKKILQLIYSILSINPPSFNNNKKPVKFFANINKVQKITGWKPKVVLNKKIIRNIINEI